MLEEFCQMKKIEFATDPSQCYGKDMREVVKELNGYLTKINNLYNKEQNNLAELCYYVFEVHNLFSFENYSRLWCGSVIDKNGHSYSFNSIMQNYGIDETQSSRLISCYEKFVEPVNDKPRIKELFFDFSKSKLFELLSVPTEQLELDIYNKVLRPDMSVKTIRDYVKNYKAQQKQNKKLLSDSGDESEFKESYDDFDESKIEMAYDPKKHYDFEYFEKKSKSQLLNIVMSLQSEYEKLKKEYKTKK